MADSRDEPEFSRLIETAQLGISGEILTIVANAAERAGLARRFSLLALDRLSATLEVLPLERGAVRITGRLEAEVTQSCVVSLEPVRATVEDRFSAVFGAPAADTHEVTLEMEDEDPPEPIEGGHIDLGELVAQHLALALDPYPRAPGARLGETGTLEAGKDGAHPFSGLSTLTGRPKDAC